MGTRLWAISSELDRKIIEEQEREEVKLLKEAMDEISEIGAYSLIDEGIASFAGDY